MTISGGRTKQLELVCHITGFTSDFLSFIVVELIRFFHGARQLLIGHIIHDLFRATHPKENIVPIQLLVYSRVV